MGYIRLHSDTESAQNQTIVGNCLFFKHYPDIEEAVYRIYRQSILYLSTVYLAIVLSSFSTVQKASAIQHCINRQLFEVIHSLSTTEKVANKRWSFCG